MRRRIRWAVAGAVLAASVAVVVPARPASALSHDIRVSEDEWDQTGGSSFVSLREAFNLLSADNGAETHLHLAQGQTFRLDLCDDAGPYGGALTGGDSGDLHIHGAGSTIVQECAGEAVLDHTGTGKLWLHDVTVTGGRRTTGSGPAGGASSVGDVEIEHSVIVDNTTNDPAGAGAIHSDGDVLILRSLLEDNSSVDGGGAVRAGGKVTVDQSAVVDNHSGTGAAISSAGAIDVFNTTVVGNTATGGQPSGVESTGAAPVHIRSVTIAGNTGPQIGRTSAAAVQLRASAIVDPQSGPNCAFTPAATSGGDNYSTDNTCPTPGTNVNNGASPSFRPLFRLGGVVPGLYPMPGSPLLDKIPNPQKPRPTDQRGVVRPQGSASDVGAIEVVPCTSFADVSGASPFCQEVGWLAGSGVTSGFPNGTFKPGEVVTRGSMAAFMYRLAGSPWSATPLCATAAFPDVPVANGFCGHIKWLVDADITAGFPDGTYKPAQGVTRASMAAFMYRLAGSPQGPSPQCSSPAFPDVGVTHAFCGHIEWLVEAGVTSGFPDGTYQPDQTVTRGSMAAFMYRLADGVLP